MGHVFGACDLKEKGSIMDCSQSGTKFDDFTRKIIQVNRWRSFHRNEFPLAANLLLDAIDLNSRRSDLERDEPGIALSLVFLYLEKQDPQAAMKVCRKLLDDNPLLHEIHTILGNIYNKIGDIDAALSEYKAALELNPGVPETHFHLGLVCSQKGDLQQAISEYETAIRLNSSYAKAHFNLGNACLSKGELDRAIEECGIAVQLCHDLPEDLCTMAVTLIQKRNILEQKLNFESSGENDKLAMKKEKEGQDLVNQAVALCQKALSVKSDLPEAHNILGMAYIYQYRNLEAEKAFLKTIEYAPDFIEAHMNLATMCFHARSLEKAALHIKRILEIDLSSGVAFQILIKIFKDQDSFAPPIKVVKK